jgi:hypothetical protein
MAENEERTPSAFERFVQRIAAVPKVKVDALEAAEREQRRGRGKKPIAAGDKDRAAVDSSMPPPPARKGR